MSHGLSKYYCGQSGQRYFDYHMAFAKYGGELNSRKFEGLVGPDDKVLDFGCGGGELLAALKGKIKVGVEPNTAAHQTCRSNGIEVCETLEEVQERDFDVIVSHHCLEHVPYPTQALRDLRAYLKHNGTLALVVPIDDWRAQRNWALDDVDHHLHTWTPRLLANTLKEAGYRPLQIKVLTHAWFRGWHLIYGRVPNLLFNCLCRISSIIKYKRQLVAVAKAQDTGEHSSSARVL
jgi:SAM-dependent methyltransferase